MKKVILVCNNNWAIWHFREKIVDFFLAKNFQVIVVCPFEKSEEKIKDNVKKYNWELSAKGGNPLAELKSLWQLRSILKEERPDFVFNYSTKPCIYGSVARIGLNSFKMVSIVTGLGYLFLSKSFKAKIGRFLYYLSLRFSDNVWILNIDDLNLFLEKKLVTPEKVSILPGEGIDTSKFLPIKLPTDSVRRVLFIGRLLKDKGILDLLEAAKILKEKKIPVEIQVLGPPWFENPSAISISEFEELKISNTIKYLGEVKDVRPFIEVVHAVCLPSYREGIPMVLLEAGAMGRIVLGTNVAGCKDVISPGVNGFLCEAQSPKSLALMIEKFSALSDNELVEMSIKSRKLIEEKFSDNIILKKYIEYINQN